MTQDLPIKKLPDASPDVAQMLGYGGDLAHPSEPAITATVKGDLPVANLPVAEEIHQAPAEAAVHGNELHSHEPMGAGQQPNETPLVKIAKGALPYALVFILGLFLYYFFFTGVNLTAIFKTQTKVETPKETALSQLESQNLASYQKWVSGFYYEVTDPKITDPESDNSGNGLSNFQKYLLNLNPKSYDTLGLGMADSQALAQGINPLSGAPLTAEQKDIVAKYIDMEVVMNRLTLANLQNPHEQVAGTSTGLGSGNSAIIPSPQPAPYTAPQTGGNYLNPAADDGTQIKTDVAGRLEIPSLNINVPIMWSKDTNSFDKDLQAGVIHYPGTAMPGQIGTTYIAGHSSNYIWAKGSYNQIFSKLGDLADNTSFKITVVQTSGKDAIFHYVVTGRKQYSPTDQEQFQNTGKSVVALSTCWPVGSTAKRLVVFGELTQVEK